jgi:hypothetical protein
MEIHTTNGVTSHAIFILQTAIITGMDSVSLIASSTGRDHFDTGMFGFATEIAEMLTSVTWRNTKLPFDTFGNSTARLRPRYRDGHRQADGDGYRAS